MQKHSRLAVSRQGFTLVEMVIITVIIMLMAALIAPNLVAVKEGQDLRNAEASILRLPTEARNEAVKSKAVVDLRVDGNAIVMERTNPDTKEPEEIKRVPLSPQMQITSAQIEPEGFVSVTGNTTGQTDTATWKWQAYPDQTSDSGGLQLQVGTNGKQMALWIPADGGPRWIDGELPQQTDMAWQAGNLEQRAATSTSTTGGGGGAPRAGAGGGAAGGGGGGATGGR